MVRLVVLVLTIYFLYLGWQWAGESYNRQEAQCHTVTYEGHKVPATLFEYYQCLPGGP